MSWVIGSEERLGWKHSEKLMLLKMQQLCFGDRVLLCVAMPSLGVWRLVGGGA
jgi:hypothetical protein